MDLYKPREKKKRKDFHLRECDRVYQKLMPLRHRNSTQQPGNLWLHLEKMGVNHIVCKGKVPRSNPQSQSTAVSHRSSKGGSCLARTSNSSTNQ